uniref:Hemocyanin alphaN n=1 Tax=Helix pomatia TaxID=6536 RepID=A0A3G2VFW4_HELPO|nr:hemocyanin alphaN [Helix pomatia]
MSQLWFLISLGLLVWVCQATLLRKNVDHLSQQDVLNLQKALRDVFDDNSSKGFDAIAAYHGYPPQCQDGDRAVACCLHGDLNFPAWHRLLTVQIEQALHEKGLSIGLPYWDWTPQLYKLPDLVSQRVFLDSAGGKTRKNAWYQGYIHVGKKTYKTARAVDKRLYQNVTGEEHTDLFEQVLHAFEYGYCQFEVQFEVAHNTIHSLVGGRYPYSVSSLDYTGYDPLFYLHHSNVDRLYAIYQEVQKLRGVQSGSANSPLCDVKSYYRPLEPFRRKSNPFSLTRTYNSADKAKDYSVFGYEYESLELNGLSPAQIVDLVKKRQSHDRAFAVFSLHNIGVSADVKVRVCLDIDDEHEEDDRCLHAGDFFVLGGATEMDWAFPRPFFFEITHTVERLHLPLDGNYHVEADIVSVNGTQLPSSILPHPYVSFRPAAGSHDKPIEHNEPEHEHEFHENVAVRKNVDRLTREEVVQLREALQEFLNDKSVEGYQAIAEFHGDPGKCPDPTAKDRHACCIHGLPTFPHWHRLIVTQVEDSLRRRGAPLGVPYWDFTRPDTHVPLLASEEIYFNPHTGGNLHNPFHDVQIAFLGNDVHTERDISPSLAQTPAWGEHTELFNAFLLALEQDYFCKFAIQFEVAHNLIHGLVGGNTPHGLSTLSYSAFDPIFYIYHSNIDRIWAIWTALQEHRGKPYKAHCAQSYVHTPLKPFAFKPPYNNDAKTYAHSTATNIYDYEKELAYTYDSLEFGGMSVPELDNYINTNIKNKNRIFVGIQLHGIKTSGLAHIFIEAPGKEKLEAGRFAILGGPTEMPWRYDNLYKHEITNALEKLDLHWAQPYNVTIEIAQFDGTPIDAKQFGHLEILYLPGKQTKKPADVEVHVRKEVSQLTEEEILDLRHALSNLEEDKSIGGYQTLGRYHGAYKWCPSPSAEVKKVCCPHGMSIFPHWHRLLVVQFENALSSHGYHGAVPYWDWTLPLDSLPALVTAQTYPDPASNKDVANPFYSAHIDDVNQDTERSPRPELFQKPKYGEYTSIAKQVLLAFEQEDFCDFEVQFEIAHNFIHTLVGGSKPYSMASLAYTAYDPIFYLHHSNTDRLWAIWQALQKNRGKPHNSANCATGLLRKPLAPFSLDSDVNPDPVTKAHSQPYQVFDYKDSFHYDYDNLEFNGLTIPQLERVIQHNKAEDRVFAGFLLHGIEHSALLRFNICKTEDHCEPQGGEFYILGDPHEIPWSYNRLFKYEITEQLKSLGLHYDDNYNIHYTLLDLDGTDLGQRYSQPTVIHQVGTSHIYGQEYRPVVAAASQVRRNLESLSEGEIESLRAAFLAIQNDHSYEAIASFHGKPGLCEHEGRKVACCVHGDPTFPSWHRLYVELVEHALLSHGSSVAVPYWDWISPIKKLPKLISKSTYYNSRQQRFDPNPFFSGRIAGENAVTTRDPQPELFNNDYFLEQALFALEQDHYCDFEIQFEILHNALHSWLGGHALYSMASLDYSAFDPVFFLHHANTDRIWAIWQELQRYRGLQYNEADCAINLMKKPLQPFNRTTNTDEVTRKYSRPVDTFDYRNNLHYEYDTLEFNHLSIPQLEELLQSRKRNGRVFAGFLIHNIGLSADVDVYVCVTVGQFGEQDCNHKAGTFSVLGGETEMPFEFNRLYKQDITRTVRELGLKLDNAANFHLLVEIRAPNGSQLDPHILPDPSIIYIPGTDEVEDQHGSTSTYLVRKNVESLSPLEGYYLAEALIALKKDTSADGYQSIATFHAIPPLCPSPTASRRYACCIHGGTSFLQWHRLYTVQFEDALKRHGSPIGVPYWDWTRFSKELPRTFTYANYSDPFTNLWTLNPFYSGRVEFEHVDTERDVQEDKLFKRGPHGWDTWLYTQVLFALEQEDFCDFEVQLEIAHNAIHSWIGGSKEHSLAHLHYASYDPAFFIHHSNTDRLFAVWQKLQTYRGHDANSANCALEQLREPLKPFSFGPPYNLNKVTQDNSRPEDTFAYKEHFHYKYDALEFVGMNIPTLDAYIKERQEHDRVFAGFLLKGIGQSASVKFEICIDATGVCFDGGEFSILGGSAEMPWQFNRLYKYEITDQLESHHVHYDDEYHLTVHLKSINGTELDSHLIHEPTVIYVPAKHDVTLKKVTVNHIRRNLDEVEERDTQSIQRALRDLLADTGPDGWASLASFHGAPARCPDPDHPTVACCQHGMPTFLHWHRLFTLQVEQAIQKHGSAIAIPYWDWTQPIKKLPDIFTKVNYYDAWSDQVLENPFAHGSIPSEKAQTVRDVQPELFETTKDGKHSTLFPLLLEALEQTSYCDFAVQFEVLHNAIHYLVGGHQKYSLSSLEYSAYDPIFFIHHSFSDKLWVVWQELQQRRHLPYHTADCAVSAMSEPMKPFSFETFNTNKFTRDHAGPNSLFDHENLGYTYDHLKVGGYDLGQLEELIHDNQQHARVFAGFLLHGIKTSGSVKIKLCQGDKCTSAGQFNLLGGPLESPWAYNRLYKRDITQYLEDLNLHPEDVFDPILQVHLEVEVRDVQDHLLVAQDVLPQPTIIFDPPHEGAEDVSSTSIAGVGVRKDVSSLSTSEIDNIRSALQQVEDDTGPNGFQNIASFHGSPARCEHDHHPVACCVHGSPNFPQWHRLYVKQWEDALTAHGAKIGIPYWDWTYAFKKLPSLVTAGDNNPFHHGVTHDGHITTRAPRSLLFNDPEFGDESFFYRQVLLAFEQTDYCDFEVQFEITHNAIHSWVGGQSPYGLSTLEYTAYDPLFLLHHSNVDRQFSIWQALQKYRGLPYNTANCAIQDLRRPLRPFSDPANVNPTTRANSRAIDAFNADSLHYQYDNLNFHGHSIAELEEILQHRQEEDRVFAEFLLHGLKTSADVSFDLCDERGHCEFAGTFAILGGYLEMDWEFDRLFRYDVTNVFNKLHLQPDSDYHFVDHITAVNGTELDSQLIRPPSVHFVPGVKKPLGVAAASGPGSGVLLRKNVNQLSQDEAVSLRDALYQLQQDQGLGGFEAIAGFHGAPFLCPENGDKKYACCVHGMPTFPHWHRLFTVQFEQALKLHGSTTGIPYWDWTSPGNELPLFLADTDNDNPFSSYTISFVGQRTSRNPLGALFSTNTSAGTSLLYQLTLDALEEDDYCHFEIMLEFLHNRIHFLIGGTETYSMSTLDYSAFDPIFMIVHSGMDRLWVLWQELQKLRRKPFVAIECGEKSLHEPLHPFDYDINTIALTREHAVPDTLFDHHLLGYEYDTTEISEHDAAEVLEIIRRRHSETRVYLGGAAYGHGQSFRTAAWVLNDAGEEFDAGTNFLLGSSKEMPWANEILWKFDITTAVHQAGVSTDKNIKFHFKIETYNGTLFASESAYAIFLVREAYTDYLTLNIPVGVGYPLPSKLVVPKKTHVRFLPVSEDYNIPIENLVSYTNYNKCSLPPFAFDSYAVNVVHALQPGDYYFTSFNKEYCTQDKKIYIHVQDH